MAKTTITRRDFGRMLAAGGLAIAVPTGAGMVSSASAIAAPGARAWTVSGRRGAGLRDFDHAMRDFMQARNIPGGQLAVMRRGKLVLARGYTWSADPGLQVGPTSLFRIASLSKAITAAAVTRLAQDGQLDLGGSIADLLDVRPLPGQSLDPRLDRVTVRRLLQHSGGWDRAITPDPTSADRRIHDEFGLPLPITMEQLVSYGLGLRLDHDPGTTCAYSNYGYVLLCRIVRTVTGLDYTTYVQRKVLDPLGIARVRRGRSLENQRQPGEVAYFSQYRGTTVFDDAPESVPGPYGTFNTENRIAAGGWLASAVDYVRFTQIFDGGTPVLGHAAIDRTFARPETATGSDASWYGHGWHVAELGGGIRTWHGGEMSGTRSIVTRREDGVTWAVLFNQLDDPSGLPYGYNDIADPLHRAADAVASWPAVDFFSDYF